MVEGVPLAGDSNATRASDRENAEGDSEAEEKIDLGGLIEGKPEVESEDDNLVRRDEESIKSEKFKEFLRNLGKNPKKWKKVMETWGRQDGTTYERHWWQNYSGSESYHCSK